MSLQPSFGGGSSPRKGKCCTQRTPVRTGLAPCTRVYWAGGLGTRSLSVILPPVLVTDQLGDRVETENGLGGREVELRQAEIGAPGVQARKEVVAVEAHLAARFGYEVFVGRGNAPGGALFGGQSAPAAEDSEEVAAMGLLLRGSGIAGAHVLARDLAVTGVEIDDGALPARLWNGSDLHVVSGTRLLRCWFTRPQLGGCLNHSKAPTSGASSINFSRVERRAAGDLGHAGTDGRGAA